MKIIILVLMMIVVFGCKEKPETTMYTETEIEDGVIIVSPVDAIAGDIIVDNMGQELEVVTGDNEIVFEDVFRYVPAGDSVELIPYSTERIAKNDDDELVFDDIVFTLGDIEVVFKIEDDKFHIEYDPNELTESAIMFLEVMQKEFPRWKATRLLTEGKLKW